MRRLFIHTPLALCLGSLLLCMVACGGAPTRLDVESLPRTHSPGGTLPATDFAPALTFGPGAAWLTGLEDDARWSVGTWLVAEPADAWPDAVAQRPVMAVGVVVERRARWARVELLSVVDAVRLPALAVRELEATAPLPAVTKRLTVVRTEGGELHVPVGTADLVTGDGVYGVFERAATGRLAARMTGVVRLVPLDPQTSRVVAISGTSPAAGSQLVLLGVAPQRETHVEIVVGDLDAGVASALQQSLDARIRAAGLAGVTVRREPTERDADEVASELAARTDRLLVWIDGDDDLVRLAGQLDRVTLDRTAVWTSVTEPSVAEIVEATLGYTHLLRGELASGALSLERALAGADDTVGAWLWLGPPLAVTWRELWRADWALETALSLSALGDHLRGTELEADAWTAELEASRGLANVDVFDVAAESLAGLEREGHTLSPRALLALAQHAHRQRRWSEAEHRLQQLQADARGRGDDWTRFVALRTRAVQRIERAETVSPETLSQLEEVAASLGELAVLRTAVVAELAELAGSGLVSSAFTSLVDDLDAFGAPGPGIELLTVAAPRLLGDQRRLADQLLLQAAAFAQAARRPQLAAAVLTELENLRLQHGESPVEGALAELYVSVLAATDQRLQLGRRALLNAQRATDLQPAQDALELAAALFASIGDPLNLAIAEIRLSSLATQRGRTEAAAEHLARARKLEAIAADPALTTLREQLE